MRLPSVARRGTIRGLGTILAYAGIVACVGAPPAIAGKVKLARKYRTGQSMAYVTNIDTRSRIDSNPPLLKTFLPAMPAVMQLNEQATVTVSSVHTDGSADVQKHFEKFEVHSDAAALPEMLKSAVAQAQEQVSRNLTGKTMTLHYNSEGKLTDFQGADEASGDLDRSFREPLMQLLRLSMEQTGGDSIYPDHKVKKGESWTHSLAAEPQKRYPFVVAGKTTMRYSGKTRYNGVKAAIVDYEFENTLTPATGGVARKGTLPALQAMGVDLTIQIRGKGQGRVLIALDDGRVLQNHSTVHQTLKASMKGSEGMVSALAQVPELEIKSDSEIGVESSKP